MAPRKNRAGITSVQRRLLSAYRELLAQAGDADRWIESPVGADLWIDGRIALRAASRDDLFARHAGAFQDFCARAGHPVGALEDEGLASLLARLDPYLEACASHGREAVWPGLALGLALVHSRGGPPRIEMSGGATVNDSLALVLSPSYRALRFAGYNTGVSVRFSRHRTQEPFRPEFGYFLITPPTLIQEELARAQFFSISHDTIHIVLFGDTYIRPVGSRAMTAALLLNAEETASALDLVEAQELGRFGLDLRALSELVQMESGQREGRPSVTLRVARAGTGFSEYQAALKAAAQGHLGAATALSRKIQQGVAIPADLGDWFHPRSQQTHATWHEEVAERLWNPVFQRLVSLLPPLEAHLENLQRFTWESWKPGQPVLDEVPEPCPAARAQGLLLYRLRFLVIRAAEVAVELAAGGSLSEALADALDGWALGVVEDYVRVRRAGGSPAAQECCEQRARAAQALLPERFGSRFDDPLARYCSGSPNPSPAGAP